MKDLTPFPRYLAGRTSALGDRLIRWIVHRGVGEPTLLLGFAGVVGAVVGAGILIFYRGIDAAAAAVAWAGGRASLPGGGVLVAAASIALGILAARWLVRHGTGDSPGENIPDVIQAVARRGGVIRTAPVAVKSLAAAVTLGSGGSVGAEGPVVVLGSALGSRVGRYFRFGPDRLRLFVGCGAAAGIAGAFGAPIAGVLFALEKILGSLRATSLAPLVVSSVAAAAVTHYGLGSDQVIRIPREYVEDPTRVLFLYAGLGLATGVVAAAYSRGVWLAHDLLGRIPVWLRVALAAVLVAALSTRFDPALWGRGHQSLNLGLVLGRTAGILFALSLAKLVATAVTLGGGGVGGVFTPAMVVGGTFGAAVGTGLHALFPGLGIEPVAFGLVGMAAAVSGSTHAPLTAIFMTMEMSGDYGLILPIMLGATLAYVVSRALWKESIYSEWLARRGEHIAHGADQAVLQRLRVSDAYRSEVDLLLADATLAEALPTIHRSRQLEFPVVDPEGVVVGVLTWDALKAALAEPGQHGHRPIRDLAAPFTEGVSLTDDLLTALRRFGARDAHTLPVVDGVPPHHVRGIISRSDLMTAYERAVGSQD